MANNSNTNLDEEKIKAEAEAKAKAEAEAKAKAEAEAKAKAEAEAKKEKTYIVETPVKNFNGEVAGVQFAYGKAEVKKGWILNWFKEKGYTVKEK